MLTAALLVIGAVRASADAVAPKDGDQVSLGLGFAAPFGHVDFRPIGGGSADNGDLGVLFSAQYLHALSPRLGAGLEIDHVDRAGTISARLLPGATSSVGGDAWLALGVLRYSPAARGTARPFALVGAGGAWNTTTVDAWEGAWPDNGARETRRLIDDGAFVPAASLRAGVDLDLAAFRPGALTLEAGWTWLGSARYAATPAGQKLGVSGVSGPVNVLSFVARYGWKF